MTRHILILNGNLPGLLTAYRLIPYGFRMTVLEPHNTPPLGTASRQLSPSTEAEQPPLSQSLNGQASPLILHRFYQATWALFQDLALDQNPSLLQPVDLEFGTTENKPLRLTKAKGLSTLHPLIRLANFHGLSWSDRWHLINFLEKQWEGSESSNDHTDRLTVESWLVSAQQSPLALQRIWNPFCRLFLGCDVTQASLEYFLEVLSRFWLPRPSGPDTFLATPDLLDHLHQKLRHVLLGKGVTFYPSHRITFIQADTARIQTIVLGQDERLSADLYVSPFSPSELLRLLPERALARFSCFSHLAHLQEASGTSVQWTLHDQLLDPRLLLNCGMFDWVTSQIVPSTDGPKTSITGVTLSQAPPTLHTDDWLRNTAWPQIKKTFNISPEPSFRSCEPYVRQSSYRFVPCLTGFRTFRPLPNTPIPNLFLSGPWTATPLPPSLESTVMSANACARAVTESGQASSH